MLQVLHARSPRCSSSSTRHDDQDAAQLTRDEQDQVVDECFQCKLCYVNCPYIPGQSEWAIDFPRLMLRAAAMPPRRARGAGDAHQLTTNAMARTDLVGKRSAPRMAPVANAATAKPGSLRRKVMEKTTGISSERMLPPFARQRFTHLVQQARRGSASHRRQGMVAVFPTCLVEYQNPAIGQDLSRSTSATASSARWSTARCCCGAPWLHSGDVDHFTKAAVKNVKALADAHPRRPRHRRAPAHVRLRAASKDYLDYVGGPDAELVAEHTYDAAST